MRRIILSLIVAFLFCGCSSSRRFVTPHPVPQAPVRDDASDTLSLETEQIVPEELVRLKSDLDQAEMLFQTAVEARQRRSYTEAQKYLDEVAQFLTEQNVEGMPDSLLVEGYDLLLESLAEEYCLVLPNVSDISVTSPAWALLSRMGESVAESGGPVCAQWLPTLSEFPEEFDMEIVVNERVEKSICFFLNQGRRAFRLWLERSGHFAHMLRTILREEGLPTDLVYLAMIESGFNPRAYSYAHAVGLWQFIKGTGRLYGLDVNWWVDERRDPAKSTRAAAKYLRDLHTEFGDWKLAIAAYNCGNGRVKKAIRRAGTDDFWALDLPRQTENHVPAFMAAAIISKNLEAFGFEDITYQEPMAYDEVSLDHCLDLKVAARCAATTQAHLKELNPELKRWCTPAQGGRYVLKIPQGKTAHFMEAYARIPDSEKVSWHRHRIRKGETLSKIALRYGVSQRAIMDANNIENRHRIRAGTYLLIPTPYGSSPVAAKVSSQKESSKPRPSATQAPSDGTVHVVRRGDTLWKIATQYGTTLSQLRKWNGLGKSGVIHPGDRLVVGARKAEPLLARVLLPPAAEASEGQTEQIVYTVKRNDTLSEIAAKHGTTVSQLRKWNGLGKRSVIHPGDRLVVGVRVAASLLEDGEGQPEEIVYTVKKGDTLWEIAKSHNVTINQLRRWNNLDRKSKIYPGEKFKILVSS